MSKLSFRARALDASKPMPIFMAEELPDLPDYSAINRAVPQMPSGMEKEEECEHHLQRAICAGLIIPTPEVTDIPEKDFYDRIYPANYKQPRQLIHMQPFTMEQDIPDYDMDSEDERWLQSQTQRPELSPLKFEEMMDRLEKSSGQTVVTLNEAKSLLKEDDELIIAVFDYWLNKRLTTQHPLILTVRTEQRAGTAANNPYLAFRRRTEKMQTRKNRKNDETSYEKMLKLRRDLHRAVTLLELVKKREKMKQEMVQMTAEIYEKRYCARDFSGALYAEAAAIKTATSATSNSRPAFTPIFHNHYTNQTWSNKAILKDDVIQRKEKRQYKKRKHKSMGHSRNGSANVSGGIDGLATISSDEEQTPRQLSPEPEEVEDEGMFAFRRNKLCSYHMPLPKEGNWPWCSKEENGLADKRYRFTLTSLSNPRRCIGYARRRVGRGGRIILDRIGTDYDDLWRTLDFSIVEPNEKTSSLINNNVNNLSEDSLVKMDTSFINNHSIVNNNNLRTDIKSEFSVNNNNSSRTTNFSESESNNISNSGGVNAATAAAVCIKEEVSDDLQQQQQVHTNNPPQNCDEINNRNLSNENDEDEMVEILRSVRRDWLHFRPKTPPPGTESPPCALLPASDCYYVPGATTPFSIELQSMEDASSNLLLDSSTFLTDPFTFDSLDNINDVPVTDTRQQHQHMQNNLQLQPNQLQSSDKIVQTGINLNVNVGLNTLTSTSVNNENNSVFSNSNSNVINNANLSDDFKFEDNSNFTTMTKTNLNEEQYEDGGRRSIGCSKFYLSDLGENNLLNSCGGDLKFVNNSSSSSTNSIMVRTKTQSKFQSGHQTPNNTISDNNATKMVNSSGSNCTSGRNIVKSDGNNVTNGLLSQLGLDGRTKNHKLSYAYSSAVGYSNNASSSTLSLHTSAHTLTLNSHTHSANILEIPLADDPETVSTKLVNSQCTTESSSPSTPTKTKTIVRKNNLVMEVT